MAALAATGAVLASCAVGGSAEPAEADLTGRSVAATDFPTGAASPIPPQAIGNALADITGAPPASGTQNTEISPSECAPAPVPAAGAVALLAPGRAERSTFTSVVAHVEQPLSEMIAQAEKCPRVTRTTYQAFSTIDTEILPPPPAPDGVQTAALRRAILTGGGTVPITTSSLILVAEQDGVRVYTEYRWAGDGAADPAETAALDELFARAVAKAFG